MWISREEFNNLRSRVNGLEYNTYGKYHSLNNRLGEVEAKLTVLSTADIWCKKLKLNQVLDMICDYCGIEVVPEETIETHVRKKDD